MARFGRRVSYVMGALLSLGLLTGCGQLSSTGGASSATIPRAELTLYPVRAYSDAQAQSELDHDCQVVSYDNLVGEHGYCHDSRLAHVPTGWIVRIRGIGSLSGYYRVTGHAHSWAPAGHTWTTFPPSVVASDLSLVSCKTDTRTGFSILTKIHK